jgi:predicted NAD/FAD-binding protein
VNEGDNRTTVGEFLARHRFSPDFADFYLLPMGSAIWSCPTGTFAQFPIRFIVDFYKNHGLLSIHNKPTWHVIERGSRTYVRAITQSFGDRIRLDTPIESVERTVDHVVVRPRGSEAELFDHVIFACHSDQALRMLGAGATATERELLSAFPYERNTAVLHTDINLLPRRRKAWAAWNYRLTGDPNAPASVTYNMNILQHLKSEHTFCVTLNDDGIASERVIKRFVYHHPVFTTRRTEAQARHGEVVNANRTSFCGAYWRNGFHEDGVVSALSVVRALEGGVEMREPTPSATATHASLFAQVVE